MTRSHHDRALTAPRRAVRAAVVLAFSAALVVSTAAPAGAGAGAASAPAVVPVGVPALRAPSPTPPPNPSDDDIAGSEQQADAAAQQVGVLSGRVSATQSRIDQLTDDMEAKQELVMKAYVDLDVAKDDAAKAAQAAVVAKQQAAAADAAVSTAEDQAADFAAASFRNGSTIGSSVVLLDSQDMSDLLARDAVLEQISQSQVNVIAQLQTARNRKANADAAARAAQQQAEATRQKAEQAAAYAEQAKEATAAQLEQGESDLQALQTQLGEQQQAYETALANTASLKSQREAYDQWLAEKKAEEERQRKLAEERRRQAALEAARQAAAERAAEQARIEAAREAAAKAAADRKAAQDAARAEAARQAAAKAAAEAQRRKDAAARAEAQRRQRAATLAAQQAAAAKAAAEKRARDAARAAAVQRDQDARARAARAESDRQAALRAQATQAARVEAARRAKEKADWLKKLRGAGTGSGAYFQNCDAARAAGFAPMRRGEPGYRAGLDPNGNGIACDAGTSADPSSGSDGGSTGGSVQVPYDGSKGAIVVNAALKYLGTPYSWGGGNASGPTTGISAGCSSTCQRYEPWNTVGFDCSGLALYAWAQVGVSLPHYSAYQYQSGRRIARADLQPGDLVFFASNTSDWTTIHHVAIYMGNNQLIEAPQSGVPVRIRGWRDDGYIGAVRPGT